jgi:hypothetical protein
VCHHDAVPASSVARNALTVAKGVGLTVAVLLGMRGLIMAAIFLLAMLAFLVVGDTLARLIAIGFFGVLVVWTLRAVRNRRSV